MLNDYPLALMLLPIALLVVVACVWIVRRARFLCLGCGVKVRGLRDLKSEQQKAILGYFRRVELRTPDVRRIFVCPACHRVYDDFSREDRQWELVVLTAYCKACGKLMYTYNPTMEDITCKHCGALHRWAPQGPAGHVFLARADGQPVTVTVTCESILA